MRARFAALLVALLTVIGCASVGASSAAAAPESLFGATTPAKAAEADASAVEVGVQFRPAVDGTVSGVRFFKGTGNTGTHTGSVWSATGTRLATGTFTGETASGWQTLTFGAPLAVTGGTTYVASYFAPKSHYAINNPYTWPKVSGNLTGVKGVYRYGATSGFPTSVFQTSNYWVDVTFTAAAAPPPTSTPPASTPPASTPPATSPTPPPAGGFPDASTTGVPAGTVLTAYTGPSVITLAGTVIDSKRITGCLDIRASNVTISRSLIQAQCFYNILAISGATGITISDTELDGMGNPNGDSAVNGAGWTCLRCNVHGTVDGFKAQTGVTIQDSWVHDLVITAGSHNDGVQSLGTTGLQILHNRIVIADGGTSAVILSTGNATDMRNVLIDRNLFGGGAFTVYGGYQAGRDDLSKVSNITISNNQFTTAIFPRSGAFGPMTSVSAPVVTSGNVWFDGPNAGQPVN